MSFYFLINNLSFAFGMIGAIILVVAAWLSYDAYKLQKSSPILMRSVGLILFAVWEVINSQSARNDILSYFGFTIFIIGLLLIIVSFLKTKQLSVNAIVVIPAFSLWAGHLYLLSAVLFAAISYLSLRQWKREYNRTWIPFSVAFLLFTVSSLFNVWGGNETSFPYLLSHLVELSGFISLGIWVWQYMRLRISESFVIISVGVTFLLATIITLAFSTILMNRVSIDTSNNLTTDVKVLSLSIDSLKAEALAKTELISEDQGLVDALSKNDMTSLDQSLARFLDIYNLGFLTVTDDQGTVIVRAHALSRRGDSLSGERAFEEATLKNSIATIEDSSVEGFSIRAGSPILSKNKLIGVVIAGFPLDNAFADRLKKLTGLEMLVYKQDTSVASTLFDTDGTTRLVGESLLDQNIKNSVLMNDTTFTGSTYIYQKPFYASFLPLTNNDQKVVGMISVAKPEQDIVDIANATNQLTLITVILIMLILLAPIYMISKRIGGKSQQ